jgi:hypothetical protein
MVIILKKVSLTIADAVSAITRLKIRLSVQTQHLRIVSVWSVQKDIRKLKLEIASNFLSARKFCDNQDYSKMHGWFGL